MTVPAIACAESIALLNLLHYVPSPPRANSFGHGTIQQEGYTLSLNEERRLASVLAFLSSMESDRNYIPAICLKEEPDKGVIRVLCAVNRSEWADGSGVPQALERGFERIFAALIKWPESKHSCFPLKLTSFNVP